MNCYQTKRDKFFIARTESMFLRSRYERFPLLYIIMTNGEKEKVIDAGIYHLLSRVGGTALLLGDPFVRALALQWQFGYLRGLSVRMLNILALLDFKGWRRCILVIQLEFLPSITCAAHLDRSVTHEHVFVLSTLVSSLWRNLWFFVYINFILFLIW